MTEHNPVDLMSAATHAIDAFNQESQPTQLVDGAIPAPDLYRITGSAAALAHRMPQALTQLANALQRSLLVLDVYYPAGPSAEDIATALGALSEAAEAFSVAAQHLLDAQAAIAYQKIRGGDAGNLAGPAALTAE